MKTRLRAQPVDSARSVALGRPGDEHGVPALLRAGPQGPQAANPSGTNGWVTTPEDVLHIFTLADFGFGDADGHSFAGLFVTTAPTRGNLAFDGSAIDAGSLISAAAIAAGQLSYEAGQNANGADFASFTFQVIDSAAQVDVSPNTLTIHVTPVNDAPIYRNFNSGSAGSLVEGQTTPLMLDMQGNGLVEDVDSSDFAGGSLRVAITLGGLPSQDVLGIRTIGTVSTSGTAAGSTVSVDGVVVGAIAAGGTGIGQDLVVEFNGAATAARVQALVRALTYFNTAENPSGQTRLVSISLHDGDGPQTSSVSLTVGVQTYNDAPILSAPAVDHLDYLPGQPLVALFQGVTMVDPDTQPHFVGGNIQINAGMFGARVELMGTRFAVEGQGFAIVRDTTTGQQIGQYNVHNSGVMVANLTNAATPEVVNALIRSFGFRTEGADPTLGETGASLTFFDGNLVFGGGQTSNMITQSITVLNPGPTPILYLHAPARMANSIVSHQEDGPPASLIQGGVLILDAAGGNQIDKLVLKLFDPQSTDIITWGFVPPGLTVTDTIADFRRVITFTGPATVAAYQELIAGLRYATTDDTPIGNRSIEVYVESEGTPSATAYAQINIVETDDLGVARDDQFFTGTTGTLFGNVNFDNGFGSDGDPDQVNVTAVNGSGGNVGLSLTLASGGTLYVSAFGGFSFEPGGAYPNGGVESFTYTLLGGTSATATIFIVGQGSSAIFGTPDPDVLTSTGPGDILVGRAGNDSYFVNSAGDSVVERANEGYDVVAAGTSWTLTAGAHVELLTTGGIEGTASINLTGNELGQQLWGNEGVNILSGGDGYDELFGYGGDDDLRGEAGPDALSGGAGNDTLRGGLGNDIYRLDDGQDMIVELAGEGDDTIVALASYLLAAGVSIETMTTFNQSGTAAITLWGNEIAQSIFGNEGDNQLLGLGGNDQLVGYGGNDVLVGGGGIDYLRGGLGNDVYGIGEGDIILEVAGEGDDSLAADIGSYYLNDGASIETLSTANQAGTFAQNLTGNELGQTVAGSEGANVLNGNLGNDLLRGYGGADIFLFDTTPGANNHDVIADMAVGVDKIALQNSVFTGLAEGNLGAGQFLIGTAAQDADDRIIWDPATNRLFFDSDGNGANAAILFAIVNGSPTLQATDFIIV